MCSSVRISLIHVLERNDGSSASTSTKFKRIIIDSSFAMERREHETFLTREWSRSENLIRGSAKNGDQMVPVDYIA